MSQNLPPNNLPNAQGNRGPETTMRMPQNIEAERALLGSILLDGSTAALASERITADDFYNELNRSIFQAMINLSTANVPINMATLYAQLMQLKLFEEAGGIAYLTDLTQQVPAAINVTRYAQLIKQASLLREVVKISQQAYVQAQLPMDNTTDFINDLNQKVFQLTLNDTNRAYYTSEEVMHSTFNMLEELHENKNKIPGVPSGFLDLDAKTAGFRPGTLNILAARPAMGKTALALNCLANAAIDHHVPAAFFSLEMTKEELGNRLLSARARIPGDKMRTGNFEDDEWNRLLQAMESIINAPIYVDETPAISITKLSAKARRLKTESNIGLIVIDYLQLMTGTGATNSREQEISEISRNLKSLAKELNIPVIALAQLNRGVESRPDKRPMLQDLRESGAIEQDADIIMFIYRDDYYNPTTEKKGISEVIVAKQRSGPTGTVELAWFGQYTLFANLAKEQDNYF